MGSRLITQKLLFAFANIRNNKTNQMTKSINLRQTIKWKQNIKLHCAKNTLSLKINNFILDYQFQ